MELDSGKLNLLIDGQFGSTGKGLFANYLGAYNHIDIAVSNCGPNAGHTFYYDRNTRKSTKKIITKHLPVSGVMNKRTTVFLCAGAIINPKILIKEIEETGLHENQLVIHPRAAVIEDEDLYQETLNNSVKTIASTMSGVGAALVRKINRHANLAANNIVLKPFIKELNMHEYFDIGCTGLMEIPQGMDLSLNHGFAYPYCTSRDITPAAALNDAGVHPKYLGKVIVCLRTYPIRVGNIIENGVEVGNSGPFYHDGKETTWDMLGLEKEYTTRTNRIRRVANFSFLQYKKMLSVMHPDYVFLNFCNYLKPQELNKLLKQLPEVTHLGFGPKKEDIKEI
jgi:adenylosuccinate synthase